MKILNLEQFLQQRGLNYPVIVGPRWVTDDAKGKPSEDRFYIIDSALEQTRTIKSVWKKDDFTSSIQSALDTEHIHETQMIYTDDLDKALGEILRQGEKAYDAYVIKQKRNGGVDEVKSDKLSASFSKLIKSLK